MFVLLLQLDRVQDSFGGFFSWAFWGVVPGMLSVVGIILIIFAGVLIVLAQQGKDQHSG